MADVDPPSIGIWGGSYGGYLTALALARNSDIFKAGVDLHGVHDWIADIGAGSRISGARYEKGDIKQALDVGVAVVARRVHRHVEKSPVLLIQGDDDRNVHFHETVDLARRLGEQRVPFEELVFPDEIHGFLRYATWLAADRRRSTTSTDSSSARPRKRADCARCTASRLPGPSLPHRVDHARQPLRRILPVRLHGALLPWRRRPASSALMIASCSATDVFTSLTSVLV